MDNSFLTYSAIVALIGSIGAQININLLIVGLRVPPNNVASVLLLTRTIAVSSCVVSPLITALESPMPYFVLLGTAVLAFLASILLPPPGHHLPKVAETSRAKFKMLDQADAPTMFNDPDQP